MGSVLKTISGDLKLIWKLFTDCFEAVFSAEVNALMLDATNLFKAEGIALQNAQPGLSTKEFIALLVETAVPLLADDLKGLGTAAYTAIAATIAADLNTPDAGGNAGVLPGGVDATPTPST